MSDPRPDGLEIGAACAWAIFTPLIVVGALLGLPLGPLFPVGIVLAVVYGTPIALAHVLLVWLLISRRWTLDGLGAGALGLLCGALPVTVVSLASGVSGSAAAFAGVFGASGAVGGVAFWWRLERTRR